jgi:HTH-type transcriptional regulator/antitoxin HigA
MTPTTTPTVPTEFTPDWVLSPGELLLDELKHRSMSQTEFAARTSSSLKHINQIVKGHVPLTPDAAIAFERTLGISASLWLRTEASWRASISSRTSREALGQFGPWLARFPLATLVEKGIVDLQDDVSARVDKIVRWFEVSDPDAFDRVRLQPAASFKRSQAFSVDPYATAVWLRLAEVSASRLTRKAFSSKSLKVAANALPALTRLDTKNAFTRAQELFAEAGVALVFMSEVSGTRISGASKLLDDGRPMIALTGRFKYLDSFWFAIAHEVGHVLLHPKRSTYIDIDDSVDDDADEQESEANSFAAGLFVSPQTKERLHLARSARAIEALATEAGVASFMLAGQYGHMTGNWPIVGKMRRRENLAEVLAS